MWITGSESYRTHGSDTKDDVESKKCVLSSNFGYLVVSSQA